MYRLIDDDEETGIVKDGEVLRTPMLVMDRYRREAAPKPALDAAAHRPGSRAITDADREKRIALYDGHAKKQSERWRQPAAVAPTKPSATTNAADHYDAYDRRTADRWRGA
ncbi:MAG: hypothetical protein Q8M26_07280 [Pseudolabrys sp.]|nr:hypothetical protein [Pseudolabrys sp.]